MKTTTSQKPWPGDYLDALTLSHVRMQRKEQACEQNSSVRPSRRSTGQSQRPPHWAALSKEARIQALVPAHHPGLHLEKPSCGLPQQQLSTMQLLAYCSATTNHQCKPLQAHKSSHLLLITVRRCRWKVLFPPRAGLTFLQRSM